MAPLTCRMTFTPSGPKSTFYRVREGMLDCQTNSFTLKNSYFWIILRGHFWPKSEEFAESAKDSQNVSPHCILQRFIPTTRMQMIWYFWLAPWYVGLTVFSSTYMPLCTRMEDAFPLKSLDHDVKLATDDVNSTLAPPKSSQSYTEIWREQKNEYWVFTSVLSPTLFSWFLWLLPFFPMKILTFSSTFK